MTHCLYFAFALFGCTPRRTTTYLISLFVSYFTHNSGHIFFLYQVVASLIFLSLLEILLRQFGIERLYCLFSQSKDKNIIYVFDGWINSNSCINKRCFSKHFIMYSALHPYKLFYKTRWPKQHTIGLYTCIL